TADTTGASLSLARFEPRIAAEQDEFSSRVRLGQMGFHGFAVVRRQMADDFRHAAALTGFGQLECPVDRRLLRHHPYVAQIGGAVVEIMRQRPHHRHHGIDPVPAFTSAAENAVRYMSTEYTQCT